MYTEVSRLALQALCARYLYIQNNTSAAVYIPRQHMHDNFITSIALELLTLKQPSYFTDTNDLMKYI